MKIKISMAVLAAVASFSTAFAQNICATCIPSVGGDVVHRDGMVGHAGLRIGVNPQTGRTLIADFQVGRDEWGRAMRYAFWEDFLDGNPNWGGKRLRITPEGLEKSDPTRWERMAKEIKRIKGFPTRYDHNHINQKGEWFLSNDFLPEHEGYWEFDCVGFTEYLYERVGLDIVPPNEEGMLLKLTVQKQRDAATLMNVP